MGLLFLYFLCFPFLAALTVAREHYDETAPRYIYAAKKNNFVFLCYPHTHTRKINKHNISERPHHEDCLWLSINRFVML